MKKLLLLLLLSTTCVVAQAQLPTLTNRTMIKFMKDDSTFMDSIATLSTLIGNIVGSGVTSFTAGTTGLTPSTPTTGAVTLAGVLNVANGGTGLSSIPTNGQILIGNGTNYVLSTITAGTGISVSNSAGGIQISTSALLTEVDGVIGNEVTNATTSGGLTRSGTGTNLDPYTLGIASGGVVTGMISDGTIVTADIANNAIDGTKINLTNNAAGDLMYYDGTDWVRLVAGGTGTFLKGGATPSFGSLAAGDIPNLASSYIVNGTGLQANANFNIAGNGTIGGDLILTNIVSNANQPINISAGAVADTVNIGTGAALKRIVLGNTTNGTDITLTAGGAIGDSISLSGGTGTTYSVGAGLTTGTIAIGGSNQTGAITLGSSTGAGQTVNINSGNTAGTDIVNIATNSATTAKNVNIVTGAAGTISIATGTFANTINIGNTTGATGINQLVGTGNFVLNGTGASTYTIGASTTSGTITMGGGSQTGALTLGQSTATNTVSIGSANTTSGNTQTVNIANGAGGGTATNVNILSGVGTAGTGTLAMANNKRVTTIDLGNVAPDAARTTTIAGGNSGVVDLINIASGATTVSGGKTVNIATGTPTASGSNLVTIGSTGLASATTINSGTGGLSMTTGAATNATTTLGTTGSQVFASSTTNSDRLAIRPQSTTNTASFTGTLTSVELTANQTYSLPNATGTVAIAGQAPVAVNATTGTISLNSTTAGEFLISNGTNFIGSPFLLRSDTGATQIYQNTAKDSTFFNLPDATTIWRGLLSATTQTIGGAKTWAALGTFNSGVVSSSTGSNYSLKTTGTTSSSWTSYATTTTLGQSDDFVEIPTLSTAITINLPSCNTLADGMNYTIFKTGTDNFAVTIDPNSTQTFFDGSTTKVLYSKGSKGTCKCKFTGGTGTWYYESM